MISNACYTLGYTQVCFGFLQCYPDLLSGRNYQPSAEEETMSYAHKHGYSIDDFAPLSDCHRIVGEIHTVTIFLLALPA
jgi:capsule polysaccharide export protein KpsC/LpsZ